MRLPALGSFKSWDVPVAAKLGTLKTAPRPSEPHLVLPVRYKGPNWRALAYTPTKLTWPADPPRFPKTMHHVLLEAFTHHSLCKPYRGTSRRLEFLGDGVSAWLTAIYMTRKQPRVDESRNKRVLAFLESGTWMAHMAILFRLDEHVNTGDDLYEMDALADLYEAWLGAVYLNIGFERTLTWLGSNIEPWVDALPQTGPFHASNPAKIWRPNPKGLRRKPEKPRSLERLYDRFGYAPLLVDSPASGPRKALSATLSPSNQKAILASKNKPCYAATGAWILRGALAHLLFTRYPTCSVSKLNKMRVYLMSPVCLGYIFGPELSKMQVHALLADRHENSASPDAFMRWFSEKFERQLKNAQRTEATRPTPPGFWSHGLYKVE